MLLKRIICNYVANARRQSENQKRGCLLLIGGVMACSVLLLETAVFYNSEAINAAWFVSIPLLLGGVHFYCLEDVSDDFVFHYSNV